MTLSKEELREIIANAKASLEQYLAMELLERREWDRQEPFGFTDGERHGMCYEPRHADRLRDPQPLYRASPPAPVVPDEIVGWVRVDYQSDDSKSYVPLFVLGSNDPSEVWGVKYEPLIACRAAMHGTTISNSADFAIDEASQSFGNSEQLEPVSQPYKLRDGLEAIRKLGPIDTRKIQAERDALNEPTCWCLTCRPVTMTDMRFVVCPDCGNKRCPKANDHSNACSGSNEPGQEGSAYPAAPKQESE